MAHLSEVTLLMSARAAELEKAREVFTAETRSFVSTLLSATRRLRTDPWITPRVRIDLPKEIETEGKSGGAILGQFAQARASLRFKRGTIYQAIADIRFGIECEEPAEVFSWNISVVPAAKYLRVDDLLWAAWQQNPSSKTIPGGAHHEKANTVRFVSRPVDAALSAELAFSDVKALLEFILGAEKDLGEAVGFEVDSPDEPPAKAV